MIARGSITHVSRCGRGSLGGHFCEIASNVQFKKEVFKKEVLLLYNSTNGHDINNIDNDCVIKCQC